MTKTLIKNATVVLPNGKRASSVLLAEGKIADIDPGSVAAAHETIDAGGLHLIPGVVDDQVHFREPGLTHKEDLYTASRACAKGGVTSFLEMPNTNPNTITSSALESKLELAASKSLVNFGFYIGATTDNVAELQKVSRTPGIKIFIGSSTGNLLVDEQEALERIFAETTLPICAHCEDETTINDNAQRLGELSSFLHHSQVRDVRAAVVATSRAIDLAIRHNHRFHVLHVSTGVEANVLLASNYGGLITAEACPHHLLFNTDDYARLGSLVQMNPSVKSANDNEQLWKALLEGRIQVIATDHAPHTWEEKQVAYPKSPSGLPAVENSLALMLNEANTGRCSIDQIVSWMCDAPARVWDMVGKGRIEVGYDADVVLVDMQKEHTVRNDQQQTKCGWSPWDGVELTGQPVRTWVMGHEVYRADTFDGSNLYDESQLGSEIQYDHSLQGYWA